MPCFHCWLRFRSASASEIVIGCLIFMTATHVCTHVTLAFCFVEDSEVALAAISGCENWIFVCAGHARALMHRQSPYKLCWAAPGQQGCFRRKSARHLLCHDEFQSSSVEPGHATTCQEPCPWLTAVCKKLSQATHSQAQAAGCNDDPAAILSV